MLRPPYSVGFTFFAIIWCLLVSIGFFFLNRYGAKPGEQAPAPTDWPSDSRLVYQPGAFNLVMAIHPQCPCSRASLEELSRLLAECSSAVKVHVLMWEPSDADPAWKRTGRWEQAERLPETSLYPDTDGAEALRFGAKTSGQMLLYGKDGRLLFSGGITSARGHEGDNPNREALRIRICNETREFSSAAVFGCPLNDPNERELGLGTP